MCHIRRRDNLFASHDRPSDVLVSPPGVVDWVTRITVMMFSFLDLSPYPSLLDFEPIRLLGALSDLFP